MSKVRDLEVDLAICEAATPGPWIAEGPNVICKDYTLFIGYDSRRQNDTLFVIAAREGWPYAIRRALEMEDKCRQLAFELEKAEREIDRLQNELGIYQEQLEQRCART